MGYANLADLKDYLGISDSTTTDDMLLSNLIRRASAAIDTYCGRKFEATTATRHYEADAVDGCYLYLDDDLLSVTTLTNGDSDATTIASTEYWLWPRNDGPPYNAIRLEANSDYSWEVDTDYMISVEGEWGWSKSAPADVAHACVRLSAYYYQQKDTPTFDTTVIPEAGVITVPQGIPHDVRLLIDPYVRRAG